MINNMLLEKKKKKKPMLVLCRCVFSVPCPLHSLSLSLSLCPIIAVAVCVFLCSLLFSYPFALFVHIFTCHIYNNTYIHRVIYVDNSNTFSLVVLHPS